MESGIVRSFIIRTNFIGNILVGRQNTFDEQKLENFIAIWICTRAAQ